MGRLKRLDGDTRFGLVVVWMLAELAAIGCGAGIGQCFGFEASSLVKSAGYGAAAGFLTSSLIIVFVVQLATNEQRRLKEISQ